MKQAINMNWLRRLMLVFQYGPELDRMLKDRKEEADRIKRESEKDYLQLCIRHQPVHSGAHFSEHNCDHCKALATIVRLG